MLNVLRGDVSQSLAAISLALNSADSETSHYAATALRDELGRFRDTVPSSLLNSGTLSAGFILKSVKGTKTVQNTAAWL